MNSIRRRLRMPPRARCAFEQSCHRIVACRRDPPFSCKSSRIVLLRRQPIPLEFGKVSQRFQVRHPIELDLAHQVVELVLDDAGEKTFSRNLDLRSVATERVNAQFTPPRNTAAEIRNTEAALPILDKFFIEYRHLRIHDYSYRNFAARAMTFDDGDGEGFVDLRSGQTDSIIFHHGFEHVIDELLSACVRQPLLGNPLRLHSEHGMSKAANLKNGHAIMSDWFGIASYCMD